MAYASNWNLPSGIIDLLTEDVHIWSASLDVPEDILHLLQRTLDAEERIRAGRFYFEQDRSRFIVCHGLLRTILASYLDIEPDRLQFNYTPNGKPFLVLKFRGKALQFNLAHSHELALYALTLERRIGVDVEQIYSFDESSQLVRRILSKQERAELNKYPQDAKLETLFRYWTFKEAYVKATGEGLTLPLEKIHLSLMLESKARMISINRSVREASRWSLQELHPAPRFAAALVIEGFDYRLNHWQWPQN